MMAMLLLMLCMGRGGKVFPSRLFVRLVYLYGWFWKSLGWVVRVCSLGMYFSLYKVVHVRFLWDS